MTKRREQIYDKEIAPLMAQIIEVCKKNRIPLVAGFELDMNEEKGVPLVARTFLTWPGTKESFYRAREEIIS